MKHALASDVPAADPFLPLPDAATGGTPGRDRPVGIEIEFGGLAPEAAVDCLTRRFGGRAARCGPGNWRISQSDIGEIALYLDTKFRPEADTPLARAGVALGRRLLPMEIVTDPLDQSDLPRLDALLSDLMEAGAQGSADRVLYGFGLHINAGLADPETGSDLPGRALAYALLERWLRRRDPPDLGRRLLPFTDPYPKGFVSDLARAGTELDPDGCFDLLARHGLSRNHGLDLLPAWAQLAPEHFASHHPDAASVSPRPAYHYRLPDCRLGSPGWTLGYEWRRWCLVEVVARDDRLLEQLSGLWLAQRDAPLVPDVAGWQDAVTASLGSLAALAPVGGPDPEGA